MVLGIIIAFEPLARRAAALRPTRDNMVATSKIELLCVRPRKRSKVVALLEVVKLCDCKVREVRVHV